MPAREATTAASVTASCHFPSRRQAMRTFSVPVSRLWSRAMGKTGWGQAVRVAVLPFARSSSR